MEKKDSPVLVQKDSPVLVQKDSTVLTRKELPLLAQILKSEFPRVWENTRNLFGLFSVQYLLSVMRKEADAIHPDILRTQLALEMVSVLQEKDLLAWSYDAQDFFLRLLQSKNINVPAKEALSQVAPAPLATIQDYMVKYILLSDQLGKSDRDKLAWHLQRLESIPRSPSFSPSFSSTISSVMLRLVAE